MSSPVYGGFGLQRLVDSQQRYTNAGLPIFYRVRNFSPFGDVEEMGFQYTPSITGSNTGTTDTLVLPQPSVQLVPTKEIEAAAALGTVLRFGARKILLSHSWVQSIMAANPSFTNFRQVFNDPSVVGFYQDGLLFQIVDFTHTDAFGQPIDWQVLCNAQEYK